jgi:hypothetical protein
VLSRSDESLEMSRADEMGRRGDIFRTGREPRKMIGIFAIISTKIGPNGPVRQLL